MSNPPAFLFDECISPRAMNGLKSLFDSVGHEVDFRHIIPMQLAGALDEEWIPKIADEGLVIITADRGTKPRGKKGEKLPVLCEKFGVNYVVFSKSIHHSNNDYKIRVLHSLWPQIESIREEPRGSGFTMQQISSDVTRVKLVQRDWRLPENERYEDGDGISKTQKNIPGM